MKEKAKSVPDEIDELVDSLHVRDEEIAVEEYVPPRFRIPRWVAFSVPVFCFLMGAIFGLSAIPDDSLSGRPPLPEPARTVTVTTTQPALPASCARAIALMYRVQQQVATIG